MSTFKIFWSAGRLVVSDERCLCSGLRDLRSDERFLLLTIFGLK